MGDCLFYVSVVDDNDDVVWLMIVITRKMRNRVKNEHNGKEYIQLLYFNLFQHKQNTIHDIKNIILVTSKISLKDHVLFG